MTKSDKGKPSRHLLNACNNIVELRSAMQSIDNTGPHASLRNGGERAGKIRNELIAAARASLSALMHIQRDKAEQGPNTGDLDAGAVIENDLLAAIELGLQAFNASDWSGFCDVAIQAGAQMERVHAGICDLRTSTNDSKDENETASIPVSSEQPKIPRPDFLLFNGYLYQWGAPCDSGVYRYLNSSAGAPTTVLGQDVASYDDEEDQVWDNCFFRPKTDRSYVQWLRTLSFKDKKVAGAGTRYYFRYGRPDQPGVYEFFRMGFFLPDTSERMERYASKGVNDWGSAVFWRKLDVEQIPAAKEAKAKATEGKVHGWIVVKPRPEIELCVPTLDGSILDIVDKPIAGNEAMSLPGLLRFLAGEQKNDALRTVADRLDGWIDRSRRLSEVIAESMGAGKSYRIAGTAQFAPEVPVDNV